MGRWSYSNKTEADDLKKIRVSFLKKHGYFESGRSGVITWTSGWSGNKSSVGIETSIMDGNGHLRIHYTQTDNDTEEKKSFDYKIPFTTTPCWYGGRRYWFVCPWYKNGVYCGKRVETIYKNGDYFACRHCYDLTYSSKKENRRHHLTHLFNIFKIDAKVEKLEKEIKRQVYAGKPTKKQRKLEALCKQATINYEIYANSNDREMLQ